MKTSRNTIGVIQDSAGAPAPVATSSRRQGNSPVASAAVLRPRRELVLLHRTFCGAKKVYVAGSFNGWSPSATPMEDRGSGRWVATLRLHPGRYEYRFVVDGKWCDDPVTHGQVANPYGSHNNVLIVASRGSGQSDPNGAPATCLN